MNFQMFKMVLEKAEEPEIKLPTSVGSLKKRESSRKTSTSALLTMPKPLTMWITTNCGKFWKRWEYQTNWPASWETYMQVKKQQLELGMEQQTDSKWLNYHLTTSKVTLKILQARFQRYVNCELPDVPAGFRKVRGTRDQIADIHWIIEKEREFQKKHLLY